MPRNKTDARDEYLSARNQGMQGLWTMGAKVGNVFTPNLKVLDGDGLPIAEATVLDVYLSSTAGGIAIATGAPSGGWAVGTTGKLLASVVTNLYGKFQTDVSGSLDIAVTQTTGVSFYICAVLENGAILIQAMVF
jgi:hypothetical protein